MKFPVLLQRAVLPWVCDACGGPAWWTVDSYGQVWYSCQSEECKARVDSQEGSEYLDRVLSVSAVVEGEGTVSKS